MNSLPVPRTSLLVLSSTFTRGSAATITRGWSHQVARRSAANDFAVSIQKSTALNIWCRWKHPCASKLTRRWRLAHAQYSGTSLIRSPMGLGKSDLNWEVTVLQGANLHWEYNLGLSKDDHCNALGAAKSPATRVYRASGRFGSATFDTK